MIILIMYIDLHYNPTTLLYTFKNIIQISWPNPADLPNEAIPASEMAMRRCRFYVVRVFTLLPLRAFLLS